MGFDIKTWTNPITLDATNINRLERGIKDAHDTLDITNQEVANLQNKQGELIKHFNNLNISSTTLTTLETINNLMQTTNILDILNNSSVLLTKTPQSFTTQELNQIYDNLRLNSFLRLTDIKLNNTSIVSGTKVTIPVDNTLNALSDNPISNKAVANALKNVNLSGGSYKLADMIQDPNHMTVTAQEKALWNSGGSGSGGGIATEVDPTVPAWAKKKTKPSYTWDEIDLKPLIPTDTGDLTQNSAGYLTTATTTTLVNNLLDSYTSSTILPINNSIAALDSAQKILQASIENKADSDHTHTSYAEYSHTHTKSQIMDFTHSHGLLNSTFGSQIANTTTDSGWSMIDSSMSASGSHHGYLLKALFTGANAPTWAMGGNACGIAYGGADVKGVIMSSYSIPQIRFSGGNGSKPVWNITLKGTSGTTYDLSALAPKTHTHAITDLKNSAGNTFTSAKVASSVSHTGWTNNATDDRILPTMSFLAYWNGAHNTSNNSNLQYCDRGRFGDIVTKSQSDYAPASHTHTGYATVYKGSSSTRTSNTIAVSTLRFASVSGSLYIWTS